MRRLFPFLGWMWGFIFTVIIGGPLGSYIYDRLNNKQSLQALEGHLLLHWPWWAAGGTLFVGISLWSGYGEWEHRRQRSTEEKPSGTAVDVPRQLRRLPVDFVGRETEVGEIVAAVRKGGAAISGLHGMGGIGKTALALKIGEILTPDYPDGQLYLDLKGARHAADPPGVKPLTAAEAMAYVIQSYDQVAQLPETDAGLAGRYQALLHGKRALLLMDNARDREQVEPLIPPAGCALLVTSRQHFALPGLFAKNLDTLPADRARELLLKIAPRIGDRADEIAKLSGYLPQALRTAAGALSERPDLSPADLVRRMRDAQKRLELTGVELSLAVSADLLSPDLKDRWLRLAVFPGSFDQGGAAAVWKLDADAAQDTLSELLRYSLLEWDTASLRYRLHDLVRDFAGARLGIAYEALGEPRATEFHLAIAREIEDGRDEGNALGGLGFAYGALGDHRRAIEFCEQHLLIARETGDRSGEGNALRDLGNAYHALGDHRRAIELYELQLAIAREIGDRRGEGAALGNLGNAHDALGEYRRAIEFHEQDLAIAREIGDRRGEGAALGNLGNAYDAIGDYRRAIQFYQHHLAIAGQIGDRRGEGIALGNLGNVYYVLGDYHRAAEFYQHHLAIAREIGDRRGEGARLGSLGMAYHALGDHRRAIEFYEQRLVIAREIGDRKGEASALFNSANALAALSDRVEAIARAEAALKIFEEIESPRAATARKALAEWRGLK